MVESTIAAEVSDLLEVDPSVFSARVEADAAVIEAELAAGTFDNAQGIVGLEYEFYAVDEETAALARVPRRLLGLIGFEKELGLHNAEMSTSPQPLNPYGVEAQSAEVKARLSAALDRTRAECIRLVGDALWTVPPTGERARAYLTDSVVDGGIRIATNMSESARYHAMANTALPAGMRIEAPHVSLQADTIMPESLITSIQPHYQVPQAEDLPDYFRYALRVAGPLLALGVNSPFFPPDCYDEGTDAREVLRDAWMEHRISVFETTLNTDRAAKVRFPADVDSTVDAVRRIVDDEVMVPMPVERGTRFDDRFAAFRAKHGTYWRWVRPVFEGATRSSAHARIEFRPLPGQPTVGDTISFQAAFGGLLEHLTSHDHPVADLDWETARDNFYAVMRDGPSADLRWIDADGEPTRDHELLFDDLLDAAESGLIDRGFDQDGARACLRPLRYRAETGLTPAGWKHRRVADALDDGDELEAAITAMQRDYITRQRETLFEGTFEDWIEG